MQGGTQVEPPPASKPPTALPSPWDSHEGPGVAIVVDTARDVRTNAFESLLKRASVASTPPAPVTRPPTETPDVTPVPPTLPPAAALTLETGEVDEASLILASAREFFGLGDFSGSLELIEKVLKMHPHHEEARAYLERSKQTLLQMYESKLGGLHKVPRQLLPPDEVIWLNMHHRAGFILSQVDGTLCYDDIIEISGMDRFDAVRIFADLVSNRIIG